MKWRRLLRIKKKDEHVKVLDDAINVSNRRAGIAPKKPTLTIRTGSSKEGDGMPRINMGLTMAELQDEAMARGIERQFLPSNKKDLLEFLVDGSIYLRKTKTWMDVERLKGKMAADCRRIEERKYSKDEAINESREEVSTTREVAKASIRDERASMREIKTAIREVRQHHYQQQHQHKPKEGLPVDITGRVVPPPPDADERKSTATSIATSVYDNKTPPCDNTASMSRSTTADDDTGVEDVFPPVVNERRADVSVVDMPNTVNWNREQSTMDLSSIQSPRTSRYRGHSFKLANRSISFHSTAQDDTVMDNFMKLFPLCTNNVCRTGGVSTSREKDVGAAGKSDFEKEQQLAEVIQRRNQWKETRTKEQMELQEKWDAFLQFEAWIISPPEKNKLLKGSMMKGFTVWCSISSDMSRHPPKHFDSTYKNLNDANSRARYLFYWRNPWRLPAYKMAEVVLIKSDNSAMSGCASTFHCVHPNGDKWIVSVVNDSTFRYLDNAVMQRHELDLV
ncbi:expressed unknown protein [Seminavis robusta]|uniref:Uncharacterized protein n=1 Tax=Seminavis robusta TaxID=568900 RepID=A0A9N8E2I1_9STRA|nr:expressed unknown protein [Seminavis robusta]|eukprot:Sro462_g147920.1 n/a (508) ;mRNA; r:12305-13828